jgi:hypothetical protein
MGSWVTLNRVFGQVGSIPTTVFAETPPPLAPLASAVSCLCVTLPKRCVLCQCPHDYKRRGQQHTACDPVVDTISHEHVNDGHLVAVGSGRSCQLGDQRHRRGDGP